MQEIAVKRAAQKIFSRGWNRFGAFSTSTSPIFLLLPVSLLTPSFFSLASSSREVHLLTLLQVFWSKALQRPAGKLAMLSPQVTKEPVPTALQAAEEQVHIKGENNVLKQEAAIWYFERFAVLQPLCAKFIIKRQAKSSHSYLLFSKHSPVPDYKDRTASTDRKELPFLQTSPFFPMISEQTLQKSSLKTSHFRTSCPEKL